MKNEPDELVTVAQAAKEAGVSRYAIYKAIDAGNLDYETQLGKIGIPRRALKNYRPNETKVRAGKERAAKSQQVASAKTPKKGKRS